MESFAAGIIPYIIQNGNLYFLLGLEASNNKWSGFVGGSEPRETEIQTAIRELTEESALIFSGINGYIIKKITNTNPVIEETSTGKTVYLYFIEFPETSFDENLLNEHFEYNKKQFNRPEFHEKKKLKWFSLNEIKRTKSILFKLKKTILINFK